MIMAQKEEYVLFWTLSYEKKCWLKTCNKLDKSMLIIENVSEGQSDPIEYNNKIRTFCGRLSLKLCS